MLTAEFLTTVVLLSASGALSPGPLFLASTLRAAKHGGRAGLECAIGHTLVEFPLVIGIAVGLVTFLSSLTDLVAVLGGIVLLAYGSLQLFQASKRVELDPAKISGVWERAPGIVVGLVFTALNPFFLLWWLTVGTVLTEEAVALGALTGAVGMFAAHVWMDYAWLTGTATLAGRGKQFLGKWYRAILVVFSVAMFYFGISFIVSGVF